MSLIVPPFYFANHVSNLTGTPSAATPGTNFTTNASNADGTSVAVISSLAFDVHYIQVGINGCSSSGVDGQALIDVLSDPAGGTSWGSFIDDLVAGFTPVPVGTGNGIDFWYHFPVFIKSGTALGVRGRNPTAGNISTCRIIINCFGNPNRPDMWWCGRGVESLGITAASSKGTNVTPGNSGSFGSWTTIGTSTHRYGAVQLGVNGSDGTGANLGYHWQIGYGSQQLPGSPTFYCSMSTGEVGQHLIASPMGCDVAASTTWQARATCSGSAEVFNAAIYGCYG